MSAEPPVVFVTEIDRMRQECRKWQVRCLGAAVALAILAVVALLQFSGTFITCRLLQDARRETAAIHRHNLDTLAELNAARADVRSTVEDVNQIQLQLAEKFDGTRELMARDVDAQVRHLIKQLGMDDDLEMQRQLLTAQVTELNRDVTRLENEILDLLYHEEVLREKLKVCPPCPTTRPSVSIKPK